MFVFEFLMNIGQRDAFTDPVCNSFELQIKNPVNQQWDRQPVTFTPTSILKNVWHSHPVLMKNYCYNPKTNNKKKLIK